MTLLETVVKLHEMEQRATPCPWRKAIAEGYEHIWRFIRCAPPKDRPDDTYIAGTLGHRKDGLIVALTGKRIIEEADNDAELIVNLRNASHDMLDVLRRFQRGDTKLLTDLIYIEEESAKFWAGFGEIAPEMQRIIDMLKRLQEGARRMEE